MKKIELLAPAGNMESLIAAVQGGCDAVYLGLKQYSARAFAGNFSHEEFIEAIQYCHLYGVKVYVTFNTLLTENEFNQMKKEIEFVYNNHADAVLVQDLGLFSYIKNTYPELDIHCSTQMHVHNLAGVKHMQNEGAKRVVLARESSLDLIKQASKTGMEIEVFGYGAICISYSGQCLFSAVEKNRSANKGMCAQFCRMKYFKEDGSSFKNGDYVLSPKDLNLINEIPSLTEAGVSSLKIEGRMKRKEYVYLVVKTFREAIDAYYNHEQYFVSEERLKELHLLFNRGFSLGHVFNQNVENRMNHYRPNHMGVEIGSVKNYKNGRVQVKLSGTLHQHDGLRIINEKEDIGLTAVVIEKNGLFVNQAEKGDLVWLNCSEGRPAINDKLHKTTDYHLINEINREIESSPRKINISIDFEAKVNQPLKLEIKDDNDNTIYFESDYICDKAKNAPLEYKDVVNSLSKLGDTAFQLNHIEGVLDDIFIPKSILNQSRRDAIHQLEDIRCFRNTRKIISEVKIDLQPKEYDFKKLLVYSKQPIDNAHVLNTYDLETDIVNEKNEDGIYKNAILNEVGCLYGEHEDCIGGMSLNITNSYALAYLLSKSGIVSAILSSELNDNQILDLLESFMNRYGFKPFVYKFVYGKRNLMIIKEGFLEEKVNTMSNYHGNIYKLIYNNGNVFIKESEAYHGDNLYCDGSYMILDDDTQNIKALMEDIYEKIYG